MRLECRGEVLQAGTNPGCCTRVLSWLIPSCLPQPCVEVGHGRRLCWVLHRGLTWWGLVFLCQTSCRKTNTAHLGSRSWTFHPRAMLTCCSPPLSATGSHLQRSGAKSWSVGWAHHPRVSIPEAVQEHPCWPCSWAHRQRRAHPASAVTLSALCAQCSECHNWAVGDCWKIVGTGTRGNPLSWGWNLTQTICFRALSSIVGFGCFFFHRLWKSSLNDWGPLTF